MFVDAVAHMWPKLHGTLHYRLMSFAGGRLSSFCRPAWIAFLLTERCNARCVHCDIWKNKGREDSPGLDGWKRVLVELRRWLGPVNIVFTGGEALLYPHTLELVRYATSLRFQVEVLTHGYWSDQTKIEQLARTNPWRLTTSVDGIGRTHSKIRGRDDFFERTTETIETLVKTRSAHNLTYRIRLKTVIMQHNLDDLAELARFATRDGMEVFFQPIEQNYNTPQDPLWFETSGNWPDDEAKAISKVRDLVELKRSGLHIANTESNLESMVDYFQNPAALGLVTQAHIAYRPKVPCGALTMLQLQANGDITVCSNRPPIGNVREGSIRDLWKRRSKVWEHGCCLSAGSCTSTTPLVELRTDGPVSQTGPANASGEGTP